MMDYQPLNIFSVFIIIVILIITVAVIFVRRKAKYGSQIRAGEQNNCCLKRKAERLGLVLHEVPGDTLISAVEDQLCHLNPNGTYTQTILRKRSKDYQHKRKASHNDMESFQHLANIYNRNIEIVHSESFGSTVFRPADSTIQRPMQTLYVGCDRKGRYYSLRPASPFFKPIENANALRHPKCPIPTESDYFERANVDSTSTQRNFMIGDNSNVLIGDKSNQYVVVNMPTVDGKEEYVEIKNIVIGEGNTQNVVATFRTAKELVDFMKEMLEQRKEFSEPALRLKLRIKSSTLTEEQIDEKESRLIELLNDDTGETRQQLEPLFQDIGVSFQTALHGCIEIVLLPKSKESFFHFVNIFQSGDVVGVIACLLSSEEFVEEQRLDIDVKLSLSVKVEAQSNRKREHAHDLSQKGTVDNKPVKDVCSESTKVSKGISIVLKQTSANAEKDSRITRLPERFVGTTLTNKQTRGLFDDVSEVDVRLEPFCSRKYTRKTRIQTKDAHDRILQNVRGHIGIVKTGNGITGTCFRIGSIYVVTALHVIQQGQLAEETARSIDVHFPDIGVRCGSKIEYYDTSLDFAVLKLDVVVPNQTNIYVAECQPGLPFYLVGYRNVSNKYPKKQCERAVIEMPSGDLSSYVLNFHSHKFGPGCSGSPGLILNGNRAYYVSMLLGAMHSKDNVIGCGVNLANIFNKMAKARPDMAILLRDEWHCRSPVYWKETFIDVGSSIINKTCAKLSLYDIRFYSFILLLKVILEGTKTNST